MRSGYALPMSVLLVALCGCGAADDQQREPPPVEDTAFGDMVGTMDRARGVEATTLQHKEDLDKALEASEGAARGQ